QPGDPPRALADELEALRLEVQALRKTVDATRERVKALEAEVHASKAPDAATTNKQQLIRWKVTTDDSSSMRKASDPLAEAEAALKKLRQDPTDRQAADALEA